MIKVDQCDRGVFTVELIGDDLDNLAAIAAAAPLDPADVIRRVLIGCLRIDDNNILLKGHANELERKDGRMGRR